MNTIQHKEKFDHLKTQMMSIPLKGEGKNKEVVPIPMIKIVDMLLDCTFDIQRIMHLVDSEYTNFDNLTEDMQGRILLKSDAALNKAVLESKGSGATASWRLMVALTGYGLDYSNVLAYLFRFHEAKNRPVSWDPRDKIEAYYSRYSDKNRDGGFRINDNEENRYKVVNTPITSLEARLKEHTMVDNYAHIALSDKDSLLNKVSF